MLSPRERRKSKIAARPRARRTAAAGGSTSGCSAVGTHTSGATPSTRTYEAPRRHTDERVGIAVQADRLIDQPLIGIEEAAPQCMRNDRDPHGRTKAVILGGKAAAKRQADAKNIEVVAAHQLSEERFREACSRRSSWTLACRPPVRQTPRCRAGRNSPDRTNWSSGCCRRMYRRRRGYPDRRPARRAGEPRRWR